MQSECPAAACLVTPETYLAFGHVPRWLHVMQEQHQQTGLLHAFQLLLTLRQLDSRLSWDRDSQLQLLSIGASLHSDAGTLVLAHGKYLKTCLVLLAPFFAGKL